MKHLAFALVAAALAACSTPSTAPDASTADASAVGTVAPDFMLPDQNPASRTHRMTVAPSAQRGVLSVWYFASAT